MDARKKEIRSILIGWVRYDGTYCYAADSLQTVNFSGLNTGAGAARLKGVKEKKTQYKINGNAKFGRRECAEAFATLGQPVYLAAAPLALACLMRPLFASPVVVTLEAEESDILISYYLARTLFAGFTVRRVMKKVMEVLPKSLTASAVTIKTEPQKKKRKAKSEEKTTPEKKKEPAKKNRYKGRHTSGGKHEPGRVRRISENDTEDYYGEE